MIADEVASERALRASALPAGARLAFANTKKRGAHRATIKYQARLPLYPAWAVVESKCPGVHGILPRKIVRARRIVIASHGRDWPRRAHFAIYLSDIFNCFRI